MNRAKTRGQRDGRNIPFSALWDAEDEPFELTVAPERFRSPEDSFAGGWVSFPRRWQVPEEQLLSKELIVEIHRAIEQLAPSQREVITLRDLKGWSSDEVCNVLGIRETNQRVLLHRARSKVRRALEAHFDDHGLSRPTK
jgi:RNA polymerase sigma-70 factor (ECF subfamily)